MVALLSCWKWLIDCGIVLVVMVATDDSGIGTPLTLPT
jgi:hypothetical protein